MAAKYWSVYSPLLKVYAAFDKGWHNPRVVLSPHSMGACCTHSFQSANEFLGKAQNIELDETSDWELKEVPGRIERSS